MLIVSSRLTGCVSVSDFASLFGIAIQIARSIIELKNFVITVANKK